MEIIEKLINKITSWNQNAADEFHQHAIRDTYVGTYLWETTVNGIWLWRDVAAIFFSTDGKVYKLTSQWIETDWEQIGRAHV